MRISNGGQDLQLNRGETLGGVANDIAKVTGKSAKQVLADILAANPDYVEKDPTLTHIAAIEDKRGPETFKLPDYCKDSYVAGIDTKAVLTETVSGGREVPVRIPTSSFSPDVMGRAHATIAGGNPSSISTVVGSEVQDLGDTTIATGDKSTSTAASSPTTSGTSDSPASIATAPSTTPPPSSEAKPPEPEKVVVRFSSTIVLSDESEGRKNLTPEERASLDEMCRKVQASIDQMPGKYMGSFAPDIDYSGESVKHPEWSRGNVEDAIAEADTEDYATSHDEGGYISRTRSEPDPREREIARYMNNPNISDSDKERLSRTSLETDASLDDLVAMTRGEKAIPTFPTYADFQAGEIKNYLDDEGYIDNRVAEANRVLTGAQIKYSGSASFDPNKSLAQFKSAAEISTLYGKGVYISDDARLLAEYKENANNPDLPQNEVLDVLPKLASKPQRELDVIFNSDYPVAQQRVLAKYHFGISSEAFDLITSATSLEELQEKCELAGAPKNRLAATFKNDMDKKAIAYLAETFPHLPADSSGIAIYRELKKALIEPDDTRLTSMDVDQMHEFAQLRIKMIENGLFPDHPDYKDKTTEEIQLILADAGTKPRTNKS